LINSVTIITQIIR